MVPLGEEWSKREENVSVKKEGGIVRTGGRLEERRQEVSVGRIPIFMKATKQRCMQVKSKWVMEVWRVGLIQKDYFQRQEGAQTEQNR